MEAIDPESNSDELALWASHLHRLAHLNDNFRSLEMQMQTRHLREASKALYRKLNITFECTGNMYIDLPTLED